jgi:hypothetical protein
MPKRKSKESSAEAVQLPVITSQTPGVLQPATPGQLADRVFAGLGTVIVDPASLSVALNAVSKIVATTISKLRATDLSLDTIEIELGVSASGQVGFLGTGVEAGVAASITLGLKVT